MIFSLRQYLLSGFGVVLALFMATAIYVNYETRTIHAIEEQLLGNRLPTVLTGERLLGAVHSSLAGLRGYLILGGDPQQAEKFKRGRAEAWNEIDSMMGEYQRLSAGWPDKVDVKRLEEMQVLVEEFRQAQQEIENISHTPKNIPSLAMLFNDAAPRAKKITAAITDMIDQEAELEATPERKLLLKLMADSRGSFALGLASIRAYLLSGDNTFRKNFESRWAVNQERFKQLSDSSHLFTSSQKSAWETYSTYIEEFGPIPPKMFLLRSSNDWNKANYWLGTKAAPRAEKINILLDELSKSQNALVAIDTERLNTEELRLETVNALMSIIGIIVGVSIAIYLSRIISVQLAFMVSSAKRISEGDLTGATVSLGAISDFNIVAEALNKTQSSLNTLINRITHSSKELSGHSKGLEVLVQESQTIINTQQQDTNLIATAMSEMGMTVREVARNTTEAAEAAAQADESSNRGHKVVVDTVDSINSLAKAIENAADTINQLGEETNAVDTILVSISGIADQTNLLALNAAIEAARAGEQGRGFAVVADEVRTLAGRTQESTIEIRAMLDRLKSGASNAVSVMELGHKQAQGSVEMAGAAKDNLQDITSTVNKIKDMNTQIATAAEEQSVVADEMTRNVSSITSGAELIVKHTSSCIEGSNAVAALASQLAEGVAEFKVKPANT